MDEKQRFELGRWRVLRILDNAYPNHLEESTILEYLSDAELMLTPKELNRVLNYLKDKELLIFVQEKPSIKAKLNGYGIDVVEFNKPCPVGVARPASRF